MNPDPLFRTTFLRHMNRLGLPVAREPFTHFGEAVGNAAQMAAVVSRLESRASVAELVRRTLGLEKLMVAAEYDARLYTAGVVSSIALASGQCEGQGSVTGQVFRFIFQHQLRFPGLDLLLAGNPALTDTQAGSAWSVGHYARLPAA